MKLLRVGQAVVSLAFGLVLLAPMAQAQGCKGPLTSCKAAGIEACVDTKTDTKNCGGCGKTCNSGFSCQQGSCMCATGQASCKVSGVSACVSLKTDNKNCGACGTACTKELQCREGKCVPPK